MEMRLIVSTLFLFSFFSTNTNAQNYSESALFDNASANSSLVFEAVTSLSETSFNISETNTSTTTTATTTTTTTKPEVTTTRRKRTRVSTPIPKGNANDLMDHLLTQWRKRITKDGYDPLYVPRIDQKGLTCWNCVIVGLATVHRTGDVTMETNATALALEADIGVDELRAQCSCEARVFVLTIAGKIKLHLVGFSLIARLEQENKSGAKAQITKLVFKQPGHFGTFFQGNGFLGMMAEWFGQTFIKDTIRKELFNVGSMKQLFNQAIEDINIFEQMQSGFF